MKTILLLILVTLSLSGCATQPAKLSIDPHARVGVVSCLPESLSIHSMGVVPALQKKHGGVDASYLNIRDETERITRSKLAQRGFTLVPASAQLRRAAAGLAENDRQALALASFEDAYDVIVSIVPNKGRSVNGNETSFGGVELIPSRVFGLKTLIASCNMTVHVYKLTGSVPSSQNTATGSLIEIKSVSWRGSWDAFSEAEKATIHSEIKNSLDIALSPAIEKLF